MKNYFTISEFAALRKININSLRYYEKLGILKPKVIDPQTKYRYYSSEQLSDLDTIRLCISLGIPLKQLKKYLDGNGCIVTKQLLEDGKALTKSKIKQLHMELKFIDHTLRALDENQEYVNKQGVYTRTLGERRFMLCEYSGDLFDTANMEGCLVELYTQAQTQNLFPLLPPAILLQYNKSIRQYLLFEILNKHVEADNILKIPQMEFRCIQANPKNSADLFSYIDTCFGQKETRSIIISNVILEKYRLDSRQSELQETAVPLSI